MSQVSKEIRRLPVPHHRYTPLQKDWLKIFTPIVENLKLNVRFVAKKRQVEIKVNKVVAHRFYQVNPACKKSVCISVHLLVSSHKDFFHYKQIVMFFLLLVFFFSPMLQDCFSFVICSPPPLASSSFQFTLCDKVF